MIPQDRFLRSCTEATSFLGSLQISACSLGVSNYHEIFYSIQLQTGQDYLTVSDGMNRSTPVENLTGYFVPDPIYINNNHAIVDMITDHHIVVTGFDASYTAG